jgi:beta-glucosidase
VEVSRRSLLAAGLLGLAPATGGFRARFPRNFLWGVATSGFQSEGHFPDSNWTRYARKSPDPYLQSADFLHRYPSDIALARSIGVNVFRTSIEWARIEPRPGWRDPQAIAYYDDLVRRIRAAGMRPMLTLDHWVHPGWVADRGGWTDPATVEGWLAHAAFVVGRYRNMGVLWITFNEPTANIFEEFGHGASGVAELATMRDTIIGAHRRAYQMIHRLDRRALVTSNTAYGTILNPLFDLAIFDQIADSIDYIGIDYYYGASVTNASAIYAGAGAYWNIRPEPEGLYYVLRNYHRRFPRLPLYVVENGMATHDGRPRPDGYTRAEGLRDHVYWLQRAVNDGIPVFGYNYWSITDNYEWGSYSPRFGLYTVNAKTDPALVRHPTDAVAAYRSIIANRGVPRGYRPHLKPAFCSWEDPVPSCTGKVPVPPAP